MGSSPMFGLIGLIIAWNLFPYLLYPIYGLFLRLLYA
jgi:hypothetical protein